MIFFSTEHNIFKERPFELTQKLKTKTLSILILAFNK